MSDGVSPPVGVDDTRPGGGIRKGLWNEATTGMGRVVFLREGDPSKERKKDIRSFQRRKDLWCTELGRRRRTEE